MTATAASMASDEIRRLESRIPEPVVMSKIKYINIFTLFLTFA
jgi:hypothetical protein